jgi:hypothetical protein
MPVTIISAPVQTAVLPAAIDSGALVIGCQGPPTFVAVSDLADEPANPTTVKTAAAAASHASTAAFSTLENLGIVPPVRVFMPRVCERAAAASMDGSWAIDGIEPLVAFRAAL